MRNMVNAVAIVAVVIGVEVAFVGGFICGWGFHEEKNATEDEKRRVNYRVSYADYKKPFAYYSKKKQEENDGE